MRDHEPQTPNSIEQVLAPATQELLSVFTRLRNRYSVTDPGDLPEDSDDVVDALEDQGEWDALVDNTAERIGTPKANVEASYLKNVFFANAGFIDRMYVIEVLDWIDQDEQRAAEMGFDNLAARIRENIQELTSVLDQ